MIQSFMKFSEVLLKPASIIASTGTSSLLGVIMLVTNVAQESPWTTIGIVITPMVTIIIALIALTYKNLVKVVSQLDNKLTDEAKIRVAEMQKLRDECRHTEERLIDKMEQISVYRHQESKNLGDSLSDIQDYLEQAKKMNITLQEIIKTKTKK